MVGGEKEMRRAKNKNQNLWEVAGRVWGSQNVGFGSAGIGEMLGILECLECLGFRGFTSSRMMPGVHGEFGEQGDVRDPADLEVQGYRNWRETCWIWGEMCRNWGFHSSRTTRGHWG